MQVLWLSNSNDVNPQVLEQERAPAVAMRRMQESTGERFDVMVRTMWPTPDLPALVDRWLDRYKPDAVFIVVPAYWSTWESLHPKLRRIPVIGPAIASVGDKASGTSWLSENAAYRALRRHVLRIFRAEPMFTTAEVVARMEEVIRSVLARENTVIVVRGPESPNDATFSAAGFARAERRRKALHQSIRQLCQELHVTYEGWDEPRYLGSYAEHALGDAIHINAATHQDEGEQWGDLLAEAWKNAHASN